jgi:hypothetical protein
MGKKKISNTINPNAFWTVNKRISGYFQDPLTALYLSNLIGWRDYFEKRGMLGDDNSFFTTREKIKEETHIGINKQTRILDKLVKEGLVSVYMKGIPQKQFKIIHDNKISEILDSDQVLVSNSTQIEPIVRPNLTELEVQIEPIINKNKYNKNKYNKNNKKEKNTKKCVKKETKVSSTKTSLNKNKPCNKYNYKFIGTEDPSNLNFVNNMNQTKKSYIAMLEREYVTRVHPSFKDNILEADNKQKYYRALTTFLLEWDKENPTRIKTYKDLVKTYFQKVFVNPVEGSNHEYYKKKYPQPHQILTENSIEIWQFYWKNNPLKKVVTKTYSLEEQKQQIIERRHYGWSLEELKSYLFKNCRKLAMNDNITYQKLKEREQEIKEFREKRGK